MDEEAWQNSQVMEAKVHYIVCATESKHLSLGCRVSQAVHARIVPIETYYGINRVDSCIHIPLMGTWYAQESNAPLGCTIYFPCYHTAC